MTAIFGLIFLGGQYYEFTHFVHEGLPLSQNLFSSTFFVLTGTHGAHVTAGVIWLSTLFFRAQQGKLDASHAETVEIAGLYWHFVDVVWIILFTLIYLLS
jgi:heme/copper-type cytochrome/quinol oxidase subunit 3